MSFLSKNKFYCWFQRKFNQWLVQRIPCSLEHHLSNRNVFILPTKFGVSYLFFVVLLFLLATNYQNNLIMMLSYLLASLFISAMLHSFYNLSDLKLIAQRKVYGFANSTIYLPIQLISNKTRYALSFSFNGHNRAFLAIINKEHKNDDVSDVLVPFYAESRGVFPSSRIKVISEYSLGLFSCWTRLDFSSQFIVYPKKQAIQLEQINSIIGSENNEITMNVSRGDDFYQLKSYQQGDSLAQISWKHVAKGQGWLTKIQQQPQSWQQWLRLLNMPTADIEEKLSYLCYLVQEYTKKNITFALDLCVSEQENVEQGHIKILANNGKEHGQKCLLALAKFKV
jgi:hypothetical protein